MPVNVFDGVVVVVMGGVLEMVTVPVFVTVCVIVPVFEDVTLAVFDEV